MALLLVGLIGAAYFQLGRTKEVGFPAPDFALPDLTGRLYRLSDFRGKVVFLNVWATWCTPCRLEMPSMEALYRRLKGSDFVMLAVSADDGAAPVQAFVEQTGLTFPILIDSKGIVSSRYGLTGYPETFIIDRQGNVVEHIVGPENWDSERSYRFVMGFLNAGALPAAASAAAEQRGG